MRLFIIVLFVTIQCPTCVARPSEAQDLGMCGVGLTSHSRLPKWRDCLFSDSVTISRTAETPFPDQKNWAVTDLHPAFVGNGRGKYYFALPSFKIFLRDGRPVFSRESPDDFVYVFDEATGRSFDVFQVGTPGIFYDAFWLDRTHLVVLGTADGAGVVACADLEAQTRFYYLLESSSRNKGCSVEEFLISTHFRTGSFAWDYGGAPIFH